VRAAQKTLLCGLVAGVAFCPVGLGLPALSGRHWAVFSPLGKTSNCPTTTNLNIREKKTTTTTIIKKKHKKKTTKKQKNKPKKKKNKKKKNTQKKKKNKI
ncbi:hypothetical protein, partial [Enterobacter intestinihominis]